MAAERTSVGRLERLLSMSSAALTVLAALILGLRHEWPWLPAAAAVAAALAVFVTDIWGVFRLNRWLANAVTIVAVAWSLKDFWELSSESKLMAIGSMLCLLQVVLFFQRKTVRIFWHLVVLSVLEVVVAAALELGPSFIPLLVLYLAVGLGTLVLLCAYRETARGKAGDWNPGQWIAGLWQAAMRRVRSRPLDIGNRSKAIFALGLIGFERSPNPANQVFACHASGQPMQSLQISSRTNAAASARQLLGRPVVEASGYDDAGIDQCFSARLLRRQTALLVATTMLFTIVFFYATPRLRDGFSPSGFFFGGAQSGFRPEVRLPRKGRIHLSDKAVMRIKLSRLIDQRSIELAGDGEPYIHGATLSEYICDAEGSRWLRPQSNGTGGRGRDMTPGVAQTTRSLVRQDIVLEPNVSRRFAIQPTLRIQDATADFGSSRGGDRGQQQRFSWNTTAILNDRQVDAIPNPNRRRNEEEEAAFREELVTATKFPAERFPRLAEVAAGVLEQSQLTDGKPFDKAVALWRHFLAPGQYEYSLNLNLSADEAIDPIEDFVANSRAGHCEYFASALAMMLRSQDIPARLVRGYKSGTFNTVGRYYLMQERDAHSWVEAWMSTEAIPATDLAGVPSEGGAWYRFDPTPGRSNQLLIQKPGMIEQAAQTFDYVELLWRDYVLSLNSARQDEIVYDPLTARASALPQWVEMRRVRAWLRRAGVSLGLEVGPRGGLSAPAFDISVAVAVIVALAVIATSLYGARVAWTTYRRRKKAHQTAANAAPAFYLRLERLMARLAVRRKPTDTPREMATAASERIAVLAVGSAVAALPIDVVDAYYRVRFGDGRLDKVESEAIEQALKKIEVALQRTR